VDNEGQTGATLVTMTSPQQPNTLPFIDPNNPLCGPGPARLDTGIVQHPVDGKMGICTVRTASTTLTIIMQPEDLRGWGDSLHALADQMEGKEQKKLVAAGPQDAALLKQSLSRPGRL
jgi:hypothetical protein